MKAARFSITTSIVILMGCALFCNSIENPLSQLIAQESKIFSNNCVSECNDSNSSSWYTFKTESEKRVLDVVFKNHSLGDEVSVNIYNYDRSILIWKTEDIDELSNDGASFYNLENDQTYHIEVKSDYCSEGEFEIGIFLNTATPPANDLCENAEEMFGGELGCSDYPQFFPDVSCATPDPQATGNCVDNTDPAVWYTFSTPPTLPYNVIFQGHGPSHPFEIFSTTSDCSGLVYEDCSENILAFHPEPSTTYYMLFAGDTFHWDVIGEGNDPIDCDMPLPFLNMGPGENIALLTTACQTPASFIPCEQDHVVWYNYTTGCNVGDINIFVEEFTAPLGLGPAAELAISVYLDDCVTLASAYDVNGTGYVCSGIGASEQIDLTNIPPATNFVIAVSSNDDNTGFGLITLTETNSGVAVNDECDDLIILNTGVNLGLSNDCATNDVNIPSCSLQSAATVWYEIDLGPDPVDAVIEVLANGISDPALAAYNDCGAVLLGNSCNGYLELLCVNGLVRIQVGSSSPNVGGFDLEITTIPALMPPDAEFTTMAICNNSPSDVHIYTSGGESGDFMVSVSPNSSSSIMGMNDQDFLDTDDFFINDVLTNSSTDPEEAIYLIQSSFDGYSCPSAGFEVSFLVYPSFSAFPPEIEDCVPFDVSLDANQIIFGGMQPFASYNWLWNDTDVLGNSDLLDVEIIESGIIKLEITDAVGCEFSVDIEIDVLLEIEPQFDFDLEYCTSAHDVITFPYSSINDINGEWTPASIDVDMYADEEVEIIFIPEADYCASSLILYIEIFSGDELDFSLPDMLCENIGVFTFPIEDDNGISGTWDFPEIDLTITNSTVDNNFTPIDSDCFAVYSYTFDVQEDIDVEFDLPPSLCKNDEIFIFENLSDDGYMGMWDVPQFVPSAINGTEFVNTWTSTSAQSLCINAYQITITLTNPLEPLFNIPPTICALAGDFTFPTITDDGLLEGTWTLPVISSSQVPGMISSTFTSSSAPCAKEFTWTTELVTALVPEFSFDTSLCALAPNLELPTLSDNNIQGMWSMTAIDPASFGGQQIPLVFEPNSNQFCSDSYSTIIDVVATQNIDFNLPQTVCWDDDNLIYLDVSDNNIMGSWSFSSLDIQAHVGTTVSNVFTPELGVCAEVYNHEIEIIAPYSLNARAIDPMDCATNDGQINFEGAVSDLEFSLDGGLSWTQELFFEKLGPGTYSILARSLLPHGCTINLEATLNAADAPEINALLVTDVMSCNIDDGTIDVNASGNNLEYSIDNVNWQSDDCFKGLSSGFYSLFIRETNATNCLIETAVEVLPFESIDIQNVVVTDISDCGNEDGNLVIIATGNSLEYSIDDGVTWSIDNRFDNLSSGSYNIIVRSANVQECTSKEIVSLEAPGTPVVVDLFVIDPTFCLPKAGSILVSSLGPNEYSNDNGVSWFPESTFEDLEAGDYRIIVRDSTNINCNIIVDAQLVSIPDSLKGVGYTFQPISECGLLDGSITVESGLVEIELSIDGGQSWQDEKTFTNLAAGIYTILVRAKNNNICITELEVVIPDPDCPCEDLAVEYDLVLPDCIVGGPATINVISISGMDNPDINFSWNTGETTQGLSGVSSGTYVLSILYDAICVWNETIEIDIAEPLYFDYAVTPSDCDSSSNGNIIFEDVSGGIEPYIYSIDGVTFQADNNFSGLSSGLYELCLLDSDNCKLTQTITVDAGTSVVPSLPLLETIDLGESFIIDPNIEYTDIDSFHWTANGTLIDSQNLVIEVSPIENTVYHLTIYYGECSESAEILIEVLETPIVVPPIIEPPVVLPPNTTGPDLVYLGDTFSPFSVNNSSFYVQTRKDAEVEINSLSIYDRWGNLVFEKIKPIANQAKDGWDGTFNNQKVDPAVFIYKLDYVINGEQTIDSGSITVIK